VREIHLPLVLAGTQAELETAVVTQPTRAPGVMLLETDLLVSVLASNLGGVRIGRVTDNDEGVAGYGKYLRFSGGPSFVAWNSDNSDPLWIARYNVAADETELRVNIGDNGEAADALVMGYTNGGTWYPVYEFPMDGNGGTFLRLDASNDPLTDALEIAATAPYLTLHNTTEEDADEGRESRIIFRGEQSGGEETTLAWIEAHHDGASDSELGNLIFSTNAGHDGSTPTERMRIDSAGLIQFGDPGTNYSAFEADGTLKFIGNATVWNDVYFPMTVGKVGGANQPSWDAFQGNTYEYTFAINDYIHLPTEEIPHSYKEGSDIGLHAHIVLDGSDAGDTVINLEIEYTIGDVGEAMSGATVVTSGDYTIPGGTADRTHLYVDIGTITGTNYLSRSALKIRFRRIALVGGGDAPSNDPFVLMVGAHVEEDTVGSRQENSK
jgi:hypothetical protein